MKTEKAYFSNGIRCPGCVWDLVRSADCKTLRCPNPGCGYHGVVFEAPRVELKVIDKYIDDVTANRIPDGIDCGKELFLIVPSWLTDAEIERLRQTTGVRRIERMK